ncbi:MAG TPA: ferredoxin-thioredoxin reductase catalytic domain-containing protein [Candidatus Nanopelagicaceae bacterium]|nr:ferredoxin-thioredoxin reductase catalytic domain-containing protein [Candidatus Nanopelagicaceae bacterium]
MDMETTEGMKEYVGMVSKKNSWILNKDESTFNDLINGLVDNKKSYGYQSCPCRLASGKRDLDRDLICPCDYASDDVKEFGACYCNLYLRLDFYETNKAELVNIPERRPIEKENAVLDYFNKHL